MDNWTRVHKQGKLAQWFARAHNSDAKLQFFIGAAGSKLPLAALLEPKREPD
jgi:hypothetical protein